MSTRTSYGVCQQCFYLDLNNICLARTYLYEEAPYLIFIAIRPCKLLEHTTVDKRNQIAMSGNKGDAGIRCMSLKFCNQIAE